MGRDETEPDPLERPASRSHRRGVALRQLVTHLVECEDWRRLFDLIESRGFLAEQAKAFGDFDAATGDVETHVLPAALRLHDWDRFLHFSLLALNLRGLAEALADPPVLRALTEGGQLALARGAAARLADPFQRAQAHAVLAASCRGLTDLFTQLLDEVTEDLDAAQRPEPESREACAGALRAIARSLGPDLRQRWPSWIERLAPQPAEARRVRQALAEGWLDRGDPAAPDLWEALAAAGDPEFLLALTPRLGELAQGETALVLDRLRSCCGGDSVLRRHATVLFLASRARFDEAEAVALWDRMSLSSIAWSPALVDAGSGLFGRLPADRWQALLDAVTEPTARAALLVVTLEQRPDPRLAALALDAVQQIPEAEPRLHWSLRYLAARPPEPHGEIQGQVGAVLGYLSSLRYAVPATDLARYLDLVAAYLPGELRFEVENVLWSPAGKAETLRTLVERADDERVLCNLLEHTERYAAAVAPTEAEGFQLRGEVLIRATCRLCTSRQNLQALQTAAERLLPEEEDELRATLARVLAARNPPPGRPLSGLIGEVCKGIHDRRRKLLSQLEALPPQHRPEDLLTPASLYAALASVDALEDERLGLAALLDRPLQLQALAERTVARMRDRERQNQALLRLAWHALGFESSVFGKRQDRAAAIELVRASLAVGNDHRLAALTPEIARLGAQRGGSLATAELQEAARRLLALDAVPWPRRFAALERVLAEAASILQPGRRLASFVDTIARLPAEMDDGPARNESRRHWPEVLPLLVAVADRLPAKLARPLARSLRAGAEAAGVPDRLLQLCLLPHPERPGRAGEILGAEPPDSDLLRALPSLLIHLEPRSEQEPGVLAALQRLPPGAERDGICLRLIRNRWVPAGTAAALTGLVQDPDLQLEARLWLGPKQAAEADEEHSWLHDFATLVAGGGADPSEPSWEPILRILWTHPPPESRSLLGQAVAATLAGGRERGEAALRLWLHAHLSPQPGLPQPERLDQCAGLQAVMERALTLGTSLAAGLG